MMRIPTTGTTVRLAAMLVLALATLLLPQILQAQYPTPNLTGSSYTTSPFARHTSPLLVGQCTWFVYGRIQEAGVISASTLSSKGIFLGNATTWVNDAISAGYSTGSQPRQGAIAVWTSGLGHVAFVENVVGGVAQFSECNATPTTVSPNSIVVCRDDLDAGGWKVRIRSGPSTSSGTVGYLPKFNVFSIVGGPTSADGYSWYHLQGGGYDGWAALLDIDTGNAATANFSWSFTRIKLTPSSSSIAMSGSPSTYIYLTGSPAPSITSVSPNPVTGSNSRQTITINGLNFVNKPTLLLTWTGQPGYPVPDAQVTYVSSTQVQMSINTTTAPDTWTVKVTNPDGQASSPATFTVQSPVIVPGEPQSLGVVWIPSPNFDNRPANQVVDSIIVHTTEGSYDAALSRLTDTSVFIDQRVSAHYIIKSTGEIVQLVDLSKRGWHATYYNDRVASASVRRPHKSASFVSAVFAGESPGGQPGRFSLAQPVSVAGRACL